MKKIYYFDNCYQKDKEKSTKIVVTDHNVSSDRTAYAPV